MKINAAKAIPPEQSGLALSQVLLEWADDQEKEFFKAIDEAAEACKRTTEQYIYKGHGVNTGDYRSHFELESENPTRHRHIRTWYVGEGRHRLTHLLENGHLTRDGMHRTEPIKHIKYGRQIAEQVLEERLAGLWGG